ncbi:MAG: ISAs1 family transposase [Chloroflexia bacterium]
MDYTPPRLTVERQDAHLDIELNDLLEAFASIPDPRRAQGRLYPLPGLLSLALAAILCNCLSVLAVAEWAELQSEDLLTALGLPAQRSPNQSTLHRLFRRLDPKSLSLALTNYFTRKAGRPTQRGSQAVAVDGKAHRGQLNFEPRNACSIHDVEAFCHELGIVLAQIALDNQGGQGELAAAPQLLGSISWKGRVLTGDALYCQAHLCRQLVAEGGDYLLVVKRNQPDLQEELATLFEAPEMQSAKAAALLKFDYREASTINKGHGRIEQRRAVASSELVDYSRWPGLAQVVQIERTWQQKGQTRRAKHYLVTSLPEQVASVEQLMKIRRGHWGIENSLHYVKDVTLGEDRSMVHVGHGGAVMSALRSTVVSLLHLGGTNKIASALRANSQRPERALALLGLRNSSGA